MASIFERINSFFARSGAELSYRQAKKLATHADPEVRCELARRHDVKPELLYFLAKETNPAVRAEIARNTATPRQADALLAHDSDVEVRNCLAEKITRLTPHLDTIEREDIRTLTIAILEQLARDQITTIRQILSETLQDLVGAPASVIRQLAEDEELIVSVPVLENSPVLQDEDLLIIINNMPSSEALSAISRRRNVSSVISSAIANSADKVAITELLGNSSAQIQEETLDLLVEMSRRTIELQGTLVQYSKLSAGAALRMAEFIADKYLHILEDRQDFDSVTLMRIKKEVHRRIELASSKTNKNEDDTVRIFTPENDIVVSHGQKKSNVAK